MSRVAFLIERNVFYQYLGPVIEAALGRGWEVECWHDYGYPRWGLKAYQFPSASSVPVFRHGAPSVKGYAGSSELREWLLARPVDVVVSLNAPVKYFDAPPAAGSIPPWIGLQRVGDFFQNNGPEGVLSCDAIAVHSDWWVQWAAGYLQDIGTTRPGDQFAQRLSAKAVPVGFTELDQRGSIDPREVRRRWGIGPDQPVVVLLPFPGSVYPESFWARHAYLEPSPVVRLLRLLAHRRFEYWPHLARGWHDVAVTKAVRAFCDRNGAFLIVKSRLKNPIPAHTRSVADLCLYDASYYPATIVEALSIANLCISFYSTGGMEAVALGAPHLCVTFSADDLHDWHDGLRQRFVRYFYPQYSDMFHCPGVSTTISIPELIATLPSKRLGEFALEPQARRRYVQKYWGPEDGQSAQRVVELMQRVAAGERVTAGLSDGA